MINLMHNQIICMCPCRKNSFLVKCIETFPCMKAIMVFPGSVSLFGEIPKTVFSVYWSVCFLSRVR